MKPGDVIPVVHGTEATCVLLIRTKSGKPTSLSGGDPTISGAGNKVRLCVRACVPIPSLQ